MTDQTPATPEAPIYAKVAGDGTGSIRWFVTCDEGWRSSIVCERMYEWAADWLVEILGREPYAPGRRPGSSPHRDIEDVSPADRIL
jgi:hypothetical protein